MEPFKDRLTYNPGLVNSKNDQTIARAINLLIDKLNEVIIENNTLKDRVKVLEQGKINNNQK